MDIVRGLRLEGDWGRRKLSEDAAKERPYCEPRLRASYDEARHALDVCMGSVRKCGQRCTRPKHTAALSRARKEGKAVGANLQRPHPLDAIPNRRDDKAHRLSLRHTQPP